MSAKILVLKELDDVKKDREREVALREKLQKDIDDMKSIQEMKNKMLYSVTSELRKSVESSKQSILTDDKQASGRETE